MPATIRTIRPPALYPRVSAEAYHHTHLQEPSHGFTLRRAPARILAGFDGSPESAEAVRRAAQEAMARGCLLTVVQVYTWDPHDKEGRAETTRQRRRRLGAHLQAEIDEALAGLPEQGPLVIQRLLIPGRASQRLVALSRHALLLVVGHRGHGRASGALMGSVSRYCLLHARCPVLVVPPHAVPRHDHTEHLDTAVLAAAR